MDALADAVVDADGGEPELAEHERNLRTANAGGVLVEQMTLMMTSRMHKESPKRFTSDRKKCRPSSSVIAEK